MMVLFSKKLIALIGFIIKFLNVYKGNFVFAK